MPIQQQSGEGGDPTLVWRDVAEIIKHLNALENMELRINSGVVNVTGKLEVGAGRCVLIGK